MPRIYFAEHVEKCFLTVSARESAFVNILLINPYLIRPEGSFRKRIQSCLPSLGLGYIAAVLEQRGINVNILDTQAEDVSLQNSRKD